MKNCKKQLHSLPKGTREICLRYLICSSLYKEYNPFHKINNLDVFTTGYIETPVDAQIKIYGYIFIEDVLTKEIIEKIKQDPLEWNSEKFVEPIDRCSPSFYRNEDS